MQVTRQGTIRELPENLDQLTSEESNLQLPPELVIHILSFLPFKDLANTCSVNKAWRILSLDVAHNFFAQDFLKRLTFVAQHNQPIQELLQDARANIYQEKNLNAIISSIFSVLRNATTTIPLSTFKNAAYPIEETRQDFFKMIMGAIPRYKASEWVKLAEGKRFKKDQNPLYKRAFEYLLSENDPIKALEVALKMTAPTIRNPLIKKACKHLNSQSPKHRLEFLLKLPADLRLKYSIHPNLSCKTLKLSFADLLFIFKFAMNFEQPVRGSVIKQAFDSWNLSGERMKECRDESTLVHFLHGVSELDQSDPMLQEYLSEIIHTIYASYAQSRPSESHVEALQGILSYLNNAEFIESFSSDFIRSHLFDEEGQERAEAAKKRKYQEMVESNENATARQPSVKRPRK